MKKMKFFLMLSVLVLLSIWNVFINNNNVLKSGSVYALETNDLSSNIFFMDNNLKKALIDLGVDANGDNEISKREAQNCYSLDLKGKNISILCGLENFTNLNMLNLENNNIFDIGFLSDLPNLTTLYLKDNKIEVLSQVPNTYYLDVSFNRIREIKKSIKVDKLKILNLSNNNISDLSGLKYMQNLAYLDLNNNQINDISPLSFNTKLESLELDNNEISDLAGLAPLINLKSLYLANNSISDLHPLRGLKKLKVLHLNENKITDISILRKLSNLGGLDLTDNPINNVDTKDAVHVKEYDFYVDSELYEVWIVNNIDLNYISIDNEWIYPYFSAEMSEFFWRVDYTTRNVEFKIAIMNKDAVVKINGELLDNKQLEINNTFITYTVSKVIKNLKIKDNIVKIEVEDEFGVSKRIYTLNIYRNYKEITSSFIKSIIDIETIISIHDDMKSHKYEDEDILIEMCEQAVHLMGSNDNKDNYEYIEMLINEIPEEKRKHIEERFEIKKMILDKEKYIDIEKKSTPNKFKKWHLKFNDFLNEETIRVGKEYFYICDEDGNVINFKLEYNKKLKEVSLTPTESYNFSKKYYLLIGSKVESINKKQLKPIRMEFTLK